MQIVDLVDDIREGPLDTGAAPAFYTAFNQGPSRFFSVVVRTSLPEQAMLPALAAAIRQVDPGITLHDEVSMAQRINETPSASLRRFAAILVGSFATLAFLLGVIGLYGVIAYSVGRRTREIGIRMALGAERGSVARLIVGRLEEHTSELQSHSF